MWDKDKVNKLELELHSQLHENLLFMDHYERIKVDSIEVILNNNVIPKYKLSVGLGDAIYNVVKEDTDKVMVKLAVLCAGEGASIIEIFNRYALKYCQVHMNTPSYEAFEEYHCKYCSYAEKCPYYLEANNNYLLKADQELAQEHCNEHTHCHNCEVNDACVYTCVAPMFTYKESYVAKLYKDKWHKLIEEINAVCCDSKGLTNMDLI